MRLGFGIWFRWRGTVPATVIIHLVLPFRIIFSPSESHIFSPLRLLISFPSVLTASSRSFERKHICSLPNLHSQLSITSDVSPRKKEAFRPKPIEKKKGKTCFLLRFPSSSHGPEFHFHTIPFTFMRRLLSRRAAPSLGFFFFFFALYAFLRLEFITFACPDDLSRGTQAALNIRNQHIFWASFQTNFRGAHVYQLVLDLFQT